MPCIGHSISYESEFYAYFIWIIIYTPYLPAALRAAQTCRYFVYSEADFEVFRPAGATRFTDGGEIWHGGGNRRLLHANFHFTLSVQRLGYRTPKTEIFTEI